MAFKTPILVLIFNREEKTKEVFKRIRELQPKQLFIAADGARKHKEGEEEKCLRTRAVFEAVDWECDVHRLYREENLGCRNAVHGGISWFFEQVEQGIILEDDCVPHPSFFPFCEKMLGLYQHNEKILHITAHNPLGEVEQKASYFFSNQVLVWGWATWRRAWKDFDINMKSWDTYLQERRIESYLDETLAKEYILEKWEMAKQRRLDSWAYPWAYSCVEREGLAIIPQYNLIQNIGFGEEATHTHQERGTEVKKGLDFPLQHPNKMKRSKKLDAEIFFASQKSKNGLRVRQFFLYKWWRKYKNKSLTKS